MAEAAAAAAAVSPNRLPDQDPPFLTIAAVELAVDSVERAMTQLNAAVAAAEGVAAALVQPALHVQGLDPGAGVAYAAALADLPLPLLQPDVQRAVDGVNAAAAAPAPAPARARAVAGDEIDEAVQSLASRVGASGVQLTRVKRGKYQLAGSSKNLFVRILRSHIMVRVGGGWDTLEHYLLTHAGDHTSLSTTIRGGTKRGSVGSTSKAVRAQARTAGASRRERAPSEKKKIVFKAARGKGKSEGSEGIVMIEPAYVPVDEDAAADEPRDRKTRLASPFVKASTPRIGSVRAKVDSRRPRREAATTPDADLPESPASADKGSGIPPPLWEAGEDSPEGAPSRAAAAVASLRARQQARAADAGYLRPTASSKGKGASQR